MQYEGMKIEWVTNPNHGDYRVSLGWSYSKYVHCMDLPNAHYLKLYLLFFAIQLSWRTPKEKTVGETTESTSG